MDRAETIDDAVDLLGEVVDRFASAADRRGLFGALYRQVTIAIRNELASFDDPARMSRFDAAFANRYFQALDLAEARAPTAPRSWLVAFDRAIEPDVLVMQHLLLGINAHINLDLAFAATSVAEGSSITTLRADYLAVNRILASVVDKVQAALNRFSPLMRLVDGFGQLSDEAIMRFSIVRARDAAWQAATRLVALEGPPAAVADGRQAIEAQLDGRAALLAERILAPDVLGWVRRAIKAQESAPVRGYASDRDLTQAMIRSFDRVVLVR